VAALLLALGAPAPAYQYVNVGGKAQRWLEGRATIFVDPVMPPDHAQAILNASLTWSQVPGSPFRYVFGGPSPSVDVTDHANGRNDLYFDSQLQPFSYAVTYAFETGVAVQERDVAFNGALTWTTSGLPAGAPDVETVALHELGHVLGLLDEDGVPSVMRSTGNPSNVQRTLFTDDEDGVRFLYAPGGGGGGGGPSGPDLAAVSLALTSGTPGGGQQLFLMAEVKNQSALPAGPFRVVAKLSPALPVTVADEEIGTTDVASLAGQATTLVSLDAFVPATAAPGKYRLGTYVDPENAVSDPDRRNNAAATATFTITRAPLSIAMGDQVDAGLGPLGVDAADLWIGEGTDLTVRVRAVRGVRPVLRVKEAGQAAVLAEASGARSAVLRWTAPAGGTYRIEFANAAETVGRVRVKTAGTLRVRGLQLPAPGEVPFPAYKGGKVLLGAAYAAGGTPAPLGCRPPVGTDFTSPGVLRGRRARMGPFAPDATGVHTLLLGGGGTARCDLLSRAPRGEILVR
jgi:hypothetical protein